MTRATIEVYRFLADFFLVMKINNFLTRATIEVYRFLADFFLVMKINIFLTRATIEEYRFLAEMFSECRGSLAQNRRKRAIFFCVILVVYLGHGSFHLVTVLFFSKSVFALREVLMLRLLVGY